MMDGITPFAFGTTPSFDSVLVQNYIGGSGGGPLHLTADPVSPKDAVTKEYVDVLAAESIPVVIPAPPANPTGGQLWYNSADGQLYIWYIDPNSAQWVIANNTGVQEAPVGTNAYGRLNKAWVPVLPLTGGTLTGPLILHNDPTTYFMAATKGYVDVMLRGYLPLTGGTINGQLLLSQDPVVSHGAATKGYVDTHSGVVAVSDTAPSNPMPGQLWFDSIGVQLYVWYVDGSGTWVQTNAAAFTEGSAGGGGGGGGIPEAPVTGLIYGRDGATVSWEPVLPLLGGTMAGPLILVNSAPVLDNEAASKRYVESAVSSGALWQGNYIVATNTPNLLTQPVLNGFTWTAVTQDPNVPENLIINLPGIAVGTEIFNGDSLRFNDYNNIWYLLRGAGLTRPEADSLYVALRGSTMIGELYLASTPFAPTMAADMQYVDSTKVVVSSLPPPTPFEGQLWYDLAEPNLYVWVVDPTSSQWVIAVNPGAAGPPAPRLLVDFEFPVNPADGEVVTTPGGASYRWDAANNRWDYVPLVGSYVNLSGDTMTGDLWVTNPTDGAGVIRISGSDQQSMRIRFRKNNFAQWMLDSDEARFRLINYAPDGQTGRVAWDVNPSNEMFIAHAQSSFDAAIATDLVNKRSMDAGLDLKVSKTGDTMTGQLRLINGDIEIDHPANALIRLTAPDASGIAFKRNPSVNDPQWTIGVNRTLAGQTAADSFSFVRFPTGDPNVFDIPLEINYSGGDVWVERARARRPDPLFPDELVTRSYVDARFAGEALFIGLLDAPGGIVLPVPGHGINPGPIPPPEAVPVGAYFICNVPGQIPASSPQLPGAVFLLSDWLISAGNVWARIGLGVESATATNITLLPAVFGATNVQAGMEEAERQVGVRLPLAGGTMIGPITGPGFICNADGGGFGTFGNGVFYKRSGGTGGLVLRSPTGNAQPQIEDNGGGNVRDILDTVSGMPKSGGAFTGGISFGSTTQINGLDISRHIALWGAGTTGFGFSMTTGRMNIVASNATTNRIGFLIGPAGLVVGEFSSTGLELAGVPTLATHATNKTYVDNAVVAAPRTWAAGQNYAVNTTIMWDGLPFIVTTAINNAPATPNYATIRLAGGSQGDYWAGVPTGWATGNWIYLLQMASYGSYRVQLDIFASGADESIILDITTTFGASHLVISSLSHNTANFCFDQFRLSATGNTNPVRLEAHIRNAGGTPDFKIFVSGFARQNNSNTTTIQKPPNGTAANLGGTQFELLVVESGSSGAAAVPSLVAATIQTNNGGWIRFPHANTTNRDDGRISARLHAKGLNIVGSATEAGDTMRYISIYGDVEVTGTNKVIARTFQSRDDNFGFQTFGDGWFYKRAGSGLAIRMATGNVQPRIENNDGSNGRDIIDTTNGDARYVRRSGAGQPPSGAGACIDLGARFPRVRSEGSDAGIGLNPPTLRADSNSIHNSNGNYTGTLFLPGVNYLNWGEPFFFESDADFSTTVNNTRTSMASNLVLTRNETAVFIWNGNTNLYDYVGTVPPQLLQQANKFNSLGRGYALPSNRGTNGQVLTSDGAGAANWVAAAGAGTWQNLTITAGWTSAASPLRARWVAGSTTAIEIQGRINSPTDYTGGFTTCATLPVGLRPTQTQLQFTISCYSNAAGNYGIARMTIAATNGGVGIQPVLPTGMQGNIDFYVSGIIAPLN